MCSLEYHQNMGFISDLSEYDCQGPGPLTSPPAVDQRSPVARFVSQEGQDVLADVFTDQSCSQLSASHLVPAIKIWEFILSDIIFPYLAYRVPTSTLSSLDKTGQLVEPGTRSSWYSRGVLTSNNRMLLRSELCSV